MNKLEQAARQADKTAMRVEQDCEEALGEDGMVMVVPLDAYNDMMEAITALREALDHIRDATKMVCNWRQPTYDDAECNAWQADCDQYWAITEGSPTENGMKFCHGCGKPIKEHPFVDSEDEK